MTQKAIERQQAIERLSSILKPGDTVYYQVLHVSRSGMSRAIQFYKIEDNKPVWLSGAIATALDYRQDERRGALKVQGCGMDMGFSVVYNLGRSLFPAGFGTVCKKCGYRPAERARTSLTYAPGKCLKGHEFYGRNGDQSGWDTNGGYALKYDTL